MIYWHKYGNYFFTDKRIKTKVEYSFVYKK